MKKQNIILLVGALCVSAISGFAQTARETTQDTIIRLKAENRTLKAENSTLNERVKTLTKENTFFCNL